MGFSRQEHCGGLPCPLGDPPDPVTEPGSPVDPSLSEPPGKPINQKRSRQDGHAAERPAVPRAGRDGASGFCGNLRTGVVMRGQFWDLHEAFGCGVVNSPCTRHAGHTQGHLGETSTPGVPGSTSVCGPVRSVSQSCPTLCSPINQPARSSVPGILQARTLEWAAIPSSRGSPRPRDQTHVSRASCKGRRVLCH